MIVQRNVFQLEFGAARDAIAIMRQTSGITARLGLPGQMRLLTDLTGEMYTLVLEVTVQDLTALAEGSRMFADPEWREQQARMTPLVRSARKDLFTVVDLPS
ncbi:hypothetical protein [Deinococcus sonorensis]|uniref:NIPSNAP domain-containing protein n=2 Tax=Deinococcus sonorensis TaxID=309891 RepID=A0AAU7U589_9DEIO